MKVGVTGGIGSGKSTVCQMFEQLGVPVYNCDLRARELMNGGGEIKRAIVALFGPEAYRGDAVDNAYVASKVFNDKMLLASLNAIVHPAVAVDFEAWSLPFSDRPYVVMESAILFESGFDRFVDRVVTVSAPEEVRLERVLARSGCAISREQAAKRMANQLTDAERETRAEFKIDNGGSLSELAAKVQIIDNQLKK